MPQGESGPPPLAPSVSVTLVIGPGQTLGELTGNLVKVQRRVQVIPRNHLERGQLDTAHRCREVREADLAGVSFAVVGDEEQVLHRPGGPLCVVG